MQFSIPAIFKIYNKYMGGTDGYDWHLSHFRPKIKTISWVPKVLIHLFNCTIVNSYLIYKFIHVDTVSGEYSLIIFVEQLMEELADEWLMSTRLATSDVRGGSNTRKLSQWNEDKRRLYGSHWPSQILIERNVKNKGNRADNFKRSFCILCNRKISIKFRECGVFLCLLLHKLS